MEKMSEVRQLRGTSYSFMNMPIDGPDENVNRMVKQMQSDEFAKTAELSLFVKRELHRLKKEHQKQPRTTGNNVMMNSTDNNFIEEEFKDFKLSDFVPSTFTEEELVDIIIDNKVEEIAETDTRNEGCCAWVLNHCK